ncbi:MAG: ATP-binding protein, partial [Candidatus Brocadiales bacterium]
FAPLKLLGIVAVIIGLISATAVASVAIIFALSTSRPIRRLTDATHRFGAGDLDYRVKVTRKDEIGDLASSFNTMAGELAREITGHKQTKELQASHMRLITLNAEVGAASSKSKTLREMLQWCTEALVKHLDVAFARIWTLNKEEGLLELQASGGMYTHIDGPHSRVPLGALKIGVIAQERRPFLSNDLTNASWVSNPEWVRREGIVAFAGYPLIVEGQVVGVMAMFARRPLAEDTLDTLASMADEVALGIERKRIEASLRESEEKYRKLIETANDAIFIADTETGIILDANMAAEALIGVPVEKIKGMHHTQLHPEDEATYYKKKFEDTVKEGRKTSTKDVFICNKDGRKIPVEISGSVIEFGSKKVLHGIFRDVTKRKQMEEMLLQSEKLKAMGEMTSGIAHEFNNVLAIIQGNVQLLERSYGDHAEMMEGLGIIRKATADGAETVRRMNEFTRVEGDSSRFRPVDIRGLIRQAIDFERPRWKDMAQARGMTYGVDLGGLEEVPLVWGSPAELREVLINMINNALDAMPGGGRLSFRTTWREGEDTVFVNISDTGVGMSEDVQRRLFDPFFTTKGPEGSGLGMSVAYGIITRHGGRIDVESRPGKGSTITLRLPVAKEMARSRESYKPGQGVKSKDRRILVVDDEKEICRFLDKFLSGEGYGVRSVDNGAEAIRLLKGGGFDLVLCDLAMPGVSGWDIIRELEALDKRPKVGLITGWGTMFENLKKDELGVDFVVKKPIEFSELSRLIESVLGTE